METPLNFIAFLYFLLVITTMLSSNQILAEHRNPNALVLGLSHSSTSLPLPIASVSSTKKQAEAVDLGEPLREVRDGYLITLNIGTPTQVIQVYMDTGSDLTWVPCGNLTFDCIDCDDLYRIPRSMSRYSPSYSFTFARDLCGSSFCVDIHSSETYFDTCTMVGCFLTTLLRSTCLRPCPSFAYTYGAGGVVTGILSRDILTVHERKPGASKEIPEFCFGCVGSTHREPIGIAGFGRGSLSFPSQLGFLGKGFSHCFLAFKFANNPNITSLLVIGDATIASKDHRQFTPLLTNPFYPNFYYIGLEAITVANVSTTQAPLSLREFDSQGNGGLLIDSGTTYTHLPEPFYSELLSVLQSAITYPRANEQEEKTGFDLCYKVPCPNNIIADDGDVVLPLITFHFLNNVSLSLPQENSFYAVAAPSNFTVVICLLFQSMEDGERGPAGVFGSFQQQNLEVVYDLGRERIGFQPMDCASASASHQGLHKS